jgi:hypothetical protein
MHHQHEKKTESLTAERLCFPLNLMHRPIFHSLRLSRYQQMNFLSFCEKQRRSYANVSKAMKNIYCQPRLRVYSVYLLYVII